MGKEHREVIISRINIKDLRDVLNTFIDNKFRLCGILMDPTDNTFYVVPLLEDEIEGIDDLLNGAIGLN